MKCVNNILIRLQQLQNDIKKPVISTGGKVLGIANSTMVVTYNHSGKKHSISDY